MPTANRSVAKLLLVLAALAAITGAMIFQPSTIREAQGAAAQPVAMPLPGAILPLPTPDNHEGDNGPGMVEPLLVSTPSASPAPWRARVARTADLGEP